MKEKYELDLDEYKSDTIECPFCDECIEILLDNSEEVLIGIVNTMCVEHPTDSEWFESVMNIIDNTYDSLYVQQECDNCDIEIFEKSEVDSIWINSNLIYECVGCGSKYIMTRSLFDKVEDIIRMNKRYVDSHVKDIVRKYGTNAIFDVLADMVGEERLRDLVNDFLEDGE